ncbi:hypothetical protein MXB_5515 [Myxobolus squamalis]|nr:hypothetical protein MXB_5515 [Myxobolus squamalis]
MAGVLSEYGFLITDRPDDAQLWVLNSCTVKNPSEDSLRNSIKKVQIVAKSINVPIVVAGCVPQGDPNAKFIYGISVIGVNQIDRIVEVVEETLKGLNNSNISEETLLGCLTKQEYVGRTRHLISQKCDATIL